MQGIDVVTVPDFQWPASELFEVRTRLFLGSWLENAGAAREWPLHLACIGEPPPSVVVSAARIARGENILPRTHQRLPSLHELFVGRRDERRASQTIALRGEILLYGPEPRVRHRYVSAGGDQDEFIDQLGLVKRRLDGDSSSKGVADQDRRARS